MSYGSFFSCNRGSLAKPQALVMLPCLPTESEALNVLRLPHPIDQNEAQSVTNISFSWSLGYQSKNFSKRGL